MDEQWIVKSDHPRPMSGKYNTSYSALFSKNTIPIATNISHSSFWPVYLPRKQTIGGATQLKQQRDSRRGVCIRGPATPVFGRAVVLALVCLYRVCLRAKYIDKYASVNSPLYYLFTAS